MFGNGIIINEIHFAPDSPEPEWIELYNTSDYAIELNNLVVSDRITGSSETSITIDAHSFLIISEDIQFLIDKYNLDTSKCIELNLPTYNNTDDIVKISNDGITLDSLEYKVDWGEKGKSLERVNYFKSSIDEENWGASQESATPLAINSIAKLVDLRINKATLEQASINVEIENIGNINSVDFKLELNVNEVLLGSYDAEAVSGFSDAEYAVDYTKFSYIPKYGDEIKVRLLASDDINSSNNEYSFYVPKLTNFGDILINEIMFDTDDEYYEFIELYNNSEETLQISSWYIADQLDLDNNRTNLITSNTNLKPKDYAIIVSDSVAFLQFENSIWDKILFTKKKISLNNSGDKIILYNENKVIIDSLEYSSKWHESYLLSTKNISLEKIRPELESENSTNWKTSTAESGSTPLYSNSYSEQPTSNDKISCTPNPFSPSSSDEPYAVISYELSFENALIDFSIYYTNGTKAIDLEKSKYSGKSGILTWNGRNENNTILPIGTYVAVIIATDQNSGKLETLKTVVVIGQ